MTGPRIRATLATLAALALFLVVAAGSPAKPEGPRATILTSIFGSVSRHDRAELRRRFLATHPSGYRIAGYHASEYFDYRFAGVYYLRRKGGVNVGSGVEMFRHVNGHWLPLRHPSRALKNNLDPVEYLYSALLSGEGTFRRLESELEAAISRSTEIHLILSGKIGAGKEKLTVGIGAEDPEPEAPATLLGGSGTRVETDAAEASHDSSCSFRLGPSELQTGLEIGAHGKAMRIDLLLGNPASDEECGGEPEDPGGEGAGIEVRAELPRPSIGKPFSVPILLNHTWRSVTDGEETGTPVAIAERTLSLRGTLDFKLLRVFPPFLN